MLEQGAAARAEGAWWNYTMTASAPDEPRVVATTRDLPGYIAEMGRED